MSCPQGVSNIVSGREDNFFIPSLRYFHLELGRVVRAVDIVGGELLDFHETEEKPLAFLLNSSSG